MNSENQTTAPSAQPSKSFTRFIPVIARLLMGLGFTVFGLNGFIHFIPEPKTAMPENVQALMGGFMKSGYMMPLISGTQLLVGVMLLLNLFVPLALILIMPVLVNIILFHVCLMPSGTAPGAILMLIELYLAWCYRKAYAAILTPKTQPQT